MLQTRKAYICQGRLLYTTLFLFVTCTWVVADSLDCSTPTRIDTKEYDFKLLAGEHTVAKTKPEDTPPTNNRLELRFNICEDLKRKDGVPPVDQCPTGTRACLVKTNKKEGEVDRVIVVIPVALSETLDPVFSALTSPAGLMMQLHGPSYPPNSSPSEAQSLNLTLKCAESQSEPKFVGYEKGVVSIEWESNAGCSKSGDDDKKDDKGGSEDGGERLGESHGSGIGWFFLLLFIAFLGYFAFGAYHNYNNFGATGWDLVPHRDFWRDVPYLLRDFGDHLCTTLRPGRQPSRRGYMAV